MAAGPGSKSLLDDHQNEDGVTGPDTKNYRIESPNLMTYNNESSQQSLHKEGMDTGGRDTLRIEEQNLPQYA